MMKRELLPKTRWGRWSVGLMLLYVVLLCVFFACMVFGLVSFDTGHWWDWTVGIGVPLIIGSFVTGILALKHEENSFLVYLSICLSGCAILFVLAHSLFIND
jgi:hypothetical protein